MRTTVEIKDEHRGRLMEMAARRGLKGFSEIVQEALDMYLEHDGAARSARRRALKLKGCLSEAEADLFRTAARRTRESWR